MHFTLDDIDEHFYLIGIHSPVEDYRIAFLLNQHLKMKFQKCENHLDFDKSDAIFPVFEFKDETSFVNYYLINNKHVSAKTETDNTLDLCGSGNYSSTTYLIPESKKVDYFIKIEGCDSSFVKSFVAEINGLKQIVTSYEIDADNLKSKNNLIF